RWSVRDAKMNAEDRGPLTQVPPPQARGRRRVRNGLIAPSELDDDRLGLPPLKRVHPEMWRVRDGIAGLRNPLGIFQHLLDFDRSGHGVDDCGLVPEGQILIERDPTWIGDVDEGRNS